VLGSALASFSAFPSVSSPVSAFCYVTSPIDTIRAALSAAFESNFWPGELSSHGVKIEQSTAAGSENEGASSSYQTILSLTSTPLIRQLGITSSQDAQAPSSDADHTSNTLSPIDRQTCFDRIAGLIFDQDEANDTLEHGIAVMSPLPDIEVGDGR
jgi:hypothetical protein